MEIKSMVNCTDWMKQEFTIEFHTAQDAHNHGMENGVIPKPRAFFSGRGIFPEFTSTGDPSLRLKNGSAQDDSMATQA